MGDFFENSGQWVTFRNSSQRVTFKKHKHFLTQELPTSIGRWRSEAERERTDGKIGIRKHRPGRTRGKRVKSQADKHKFGEKGWKILGRRLLSKDWT